MKRFFCAVLLVLALMLPALALGEAMLLVGMPEDARMVENIGFDDGESIQSYQLDGGAMVQLMRYVDAGLSVRAMAESNWAGYTDAQRLSVSSVSGYPAEGMRFTYTEGVDGAARVLHVTTVLVRMDDKSLVFEAVCPEGADAENMVARMIETMTVTGIN